MQSRGGKDKVRMNWSIGTVTEKACESRLLHWRPWICADPCPLSPGRGAQVQSGEGYRSTTEMKEDMNKWDKGIGKWLK